MDNENNNIEKENIEQQETQEEINLSINNIDNLSVNKKQIKNNVFLIIIVIILIILGICGYFLFNNIDIKKLFNKNQCNKQIQELEQKLENEQLKNIELETTLSLKEQEIKTKNENVEINNEENIKEEDNTSILSKLYSNEKYILILLSYDVEWKMAKGSNMKKNPNFGHFELGISEYYGSTWYYGSFDIEQDKIKLIPKNGCLTVSNCELSDEVNIKDRNDGYTEITLDYSEENIKIGKDILKRK